MGDYEYLFGPVHSRRFGRSLGVDLTSYKTCSLDCVFCQLGPQIRRSPAEKFAEALSGERLSSLCHLFRPKAEVIDEFSTEKNISLQANKETVLAILRRRPCTADQIAKSFGMHLNEVLKYLGNLMRTGQIRAERKDNSVYYSAASKEGADYAHV